MRSEKGLTVLLVDDEPLILEVCGEMLRRSGYRVLSSANGHSGLTTFRLHSLEIDLVVADVVMPDLFGMEMADAMKAQRPDLRVAFMSGYGPDVIPKEHDNPYFPLLVKPFTSEQFLNFIANAVASPVRTVTSEHRRLEAT